MTENADNLILEQLRAIRTAIDRLEENDREMKARLTSIEQSLSGTRRDTGQLYGDIADQHARFDRLAERVQRLEKRLELRDSP